MIFFLIPFYKNKQDLSVILQYVCVPITWSLNKSTELLDVLKGVIQLVSPRQSSCTEFNWTLLTKKKSETIKSDHCPQKIKTIAVSLINEGKKIAI